LEDQLVVEAASDLEVLHPTQSTPFSRIWGLFLGRMCCEDISESSYTKPIKWWIY